VTAEDINPVEKMANVFNVTLLSTQLEQLVDVEPVKDFR
jgi:acetolactate synthase regulatory subunit